MNTIQEDKFSMYYAVKNVCETYQVTWANNAVFAASYNLWAEKIPLIETNRDAQTLQTTGITTDKSAKRTAMTDQALFIENRLQSYANVTKKPELFESIKYSASDLKKARDTDVVGICNTILAKASANAADIESYGVNSRMIAGFQYAIAAYAETLAKPIVAKSQTKTATENLTKLFKEADDILTNRMDLDIELFKASMPEFYSQYKTARIIIATGGGITSVLGSVTKAGSSEPIKGATFSFTAENNGMMKAASAETAKPIVKKSAEKGNFRTNLPEGTYNVVVSKIGFKEQVLTITVAKGETTNLKVELEKL
jgi:hypothetical protein